MPVSASAKKALRRDQRRTIGNRRIRVALKTAVKKMVTQPTPENLASTFKVLDRAAKKHVIHDNKAARLKSRLSKLTSGEVVSKPEKPKAVKSKAAAVKKAAKTTPKAKTTKKTTPAKVTAKAKK